MIILDFGIVVIVIVLLLLVVANETATIVFSLLFAIRLLFISFNIFHHIYSIVRYRRSIILSILDLGISIFRIQLFYESVLITAGSVHHSGGLGFISAIVDFVIILFFAGLLFLAGELLGTLYLTLEPNKEFPSNYIFKYIIPVNLLCVGLLALLRYVII